MIKLTKKEMQVARLVTVGFTVKDIANMLHTTLESVMMTKQRIREKSGARCVEQIATLVNRTCLILEWPIDELWMIYGKGEV